MNNPVPRDLLQRWIALYILCLGVLMIVLDTTIVTVALPSIQADLGFSATSLVWVLNAYMLTFGGFLLLGGRLGDLYGSRRLFLAGLAVFTVASLVCGIATEQWELVVARAVQGLGGAVVSAVGLSLIINLFPEPDERARAMGIYGFVAAAGGSIGEVAGGLLTAAFGWSSIFLVNLPIGVLVYVLCVKLLPDDPGLDGAPRLDVAGAVAVTLALMLAVYGVVDANAAGWTSVQTLGLLAAAVALLGVFLRIQSRAPAPLMPLRLFRSRTLSVANTIGALLAAGMFGWFVISALYMQRVLGYDPLRVGLAFLPADGIMAAFSVGLSARMVIRFGIRGPVWIGLLLGALGLALFARAPVDGTFVVDVLPGMVLLGVCGGMVFNPVLLAAMNDVGEHESGLASGIVNTAFMMGGALGLAVLASLGDARSSALQAAGVEALNALNRGYQFAFLLGACLVAVAAALGFALLGPRAGGRGAEERRNRA